MRRELPAPVATDIHPLEPDRKLGPSRLTCFVARAIAPVCNGDVAVKLHLHGIEVPRRVGCRPDGRKPLCLVLESKRRPPGCPTVAVSEGEVARTGTFKKCDVTSDDGRFHLSFELQDLSSLVLTGSQTGQTQDEQSTHRNAHFSFSRQHLSRFPLVSTEPIEK